MEIHQTTSVSVPPNSKLSYVLSALRDVIISQQNENQQHEPTASEYLALISATLNSNVETEHLSEILQILISILPHSSVSLVQLRFKTLMTCLLQLGNSCGVNHRKILKYILKSIGLLCNMQEVSDVVWITKLALQAVNALLGFIDDVQFRIRKEIHEHLRALLQNHKNHSNYLTIRSYIHDFCLEVMKSCTRSEYKRSLHILVFLENSAVFLPESKSLKLFQTVLNLQKCNQSILTAQVFRFIDSFFQNPFNSLTVNHGYQLVIMLMKNRPETADMEANTYYCTACASAVAYIYKRDAFIKLDILPSLTVLLIQMCEAEFTQIHCAVTASLKRIFSCCLTDELIKQSTESNTHAKFLSSIIESTDVVLQLRYQHAWIYVLDVTRFLFEKLRGDPCVFLSNCLTKLADLYHAIEAQSISIDVPIHTAIGDSIGVALKSCGVGMFLSLCPFRLASSNSPSFVLMDDSREWILTILQLNLKHMTCSLFDFGQYILKVIKNYHHILDNYQSYEMSTMDAKKIRIRITQLWSLFPEFCHLNPVGIETSFPHMPSVLDQYLNNSEFPELQQSILQGLASIARVVHNRNNMQVISSNESSVEVQTLQTYSSSIIGNLLKILETMSINDKNFSLAISCVGSWISIAPKKIVDNIAKKLLQLLLASTTSSISLNDKAMDIDEDNSNSAAASWMSVMIVIVPYLSNTMIELLYRSIRPLLNTITDQQLSSTLQKRAYNILESLLRTHATQVFAYESPMQILSVISDSLLTCHVSSRSIRLKCIEILFETLFNSSTSKSRESSPVVSDNEVSQAIDSVFGEVQICQKDSNKKTRDCAMDLMRMMISKIDSVEMFTKLCAGIAAETSSMRSSSLIGLCMLLLEKRDDPALLELACQFVTTVSLLLEESNGKCSEQTRAVLAYVRVCSAVLPVDYLIPALPQLVYCFTDGIKDEKSKYLSRCRAIVRKLTRRVGEETLKQIIPATDLPLLVYVQRMNRRQQKRKQEASKDRLQRVLGSDSDNDSDDDVNAADDDDNMDSDSGKDEVETSKLARPKATLASDVLNTFTTSLDDLLNDGEYNNNSRIEVIQHHSRSEKQKAVSKFSKSNQKDADEDNMNDDGEEFVVVVSENGQVIVKAKDIKIVEVDESKHKGNQKSKDDDDDDNIHKSNYKGDTIEKKRVRLPGEEYRSKKARGDVWRKGMLEPHAFIPLNPRMLTNNNRKQALQTIGSVISNKRNKVKLTSKKSVRGKDSVGNRNQRRSARGHAR